MPSHFSRFSSPSGNPDQPDIRFSKFLKCDYFFWTPLAATFGSRLFEIQHRFLTVALIFTNDVTRGNPFYMCLFHCSSRIEDDSSATNVANH